MSRNIAIRVATLVHLFGEVWNLFRVATLIQYGPELHQGHNPDPKLTENTLGSQP